MDAFSQVDHYRIIRKLGSGGYAKVKLALDTQTGHQVALKLMKGSETTTSTPLLATIQREIQALNSLNHPNIVHIYGSSLNAVYKCKSGREYDVIYIAMELLPKGELFDVLFFTGRMEEPIARVYFRQILDAVGSCHARGITHRDLKPENILFDEYFNVKIADFGFAAPTGGRDGSGYLRTYLGTQSYMAPEIFMHQPYSGQSVDLFACGVILFILFSQHPPFMRAQQSDSHYILFITENSRFWTLHSRNKPQGFYSPEFRELINGMLAFDPARRFNLEQVLASAWVNGQTASPAAGTTAEEAHREIARRHALAQEKKAQAARRAAPRNTRPGQYKGDLGESTPGPKALTPFIEGTNKYTRIFTNLTADLVMTLLKDFLEEKSAEVNEHTYKFKLQAKLSSTKIGAVESELFEASEDAGCVDLTKEIGAVEFCIELFEASEGAVCVDLTKVEGSTYEFMKVFEVIKEELEKATAAE